MSLNNSREDAVQKIPLKNHVHTLLIGLAIAAVMGYFQNLRRGDVAGFVFGMVFTPAILWCLNVIWLRRKMRKQTPPEGG